MKNFKKKTVIYCFIIIFCIIAFCLWFFSTSDSSDDAFILVQTDENDFEGKEYGNNPGIIIQNDVFTDIQELIKVYITGEITYPGVYEIVKGARLEDVVELAGGVTADADLNKINLAKKVIDEQHVIIPKFGESELIGDNSAESIQESETSTKININTADKNMLMTLPGVGQSIADAIISYRESFGGFRNIEELKNVYKIGEKSYARLKEFVKVED